MCLLASMFVWQNLGSGHALCLPWACACWSLGPLSYVAAFVPLVGCLDVTACEIRPRGIGLLDAYRSLLRAILCLPCLLCVTRLSFFISLHHCMLAYMFMHESLYVCVIKPSSYDLVLVQTRP